MYNGSKQQLKNLALARKSASSKLPCCYCSKQHVLGNIKKHESACYLNPINMRYCEVCQSPIKNYKTSVTCSYSCSNTKFRSGPDHPNWKEQTGESTSIRSTCFYYHKKQCVICEENKIVEVHHLDGNHQNNKPENLIPLCPTHHQYWHSRYKCLVEQQVYDYINQWILSERRESNSHECPPSKGGGLPN